MVEVDSLDRAILAVLRDSARAPFVDIAKQVGVTERTVRTRMRRMEGDGVVRGYTIREAGIGLTALVVFHQCFVNVSNILSILIIIDDFGTYVPRY